MQSVRPFVCLYALFPTIQLPPVERDSFPSVFDVVSNDEEPSGVADSGASAGQVGQRDPQRLQLASSQLHVSTFEDVFHVGGEFDPLAVHVLTRHHVRL